MVEEGWRGGETSGDRDDDDDDGGVSDGSNSDGGVEPRGSSFGSSRSTRAAAVRRVLRFNALGTLRDDLVFGGRGPRVTRVGATADRE